MFYPNRLFLRDFGLFIPPAAAPSTQNPNDAPCKSRLCQIAYPDGEMLKRQSAPISDRVPHIAAVVMPQAKADSPHRFADTNPPKKFEGNSERSAKGKISPRGSGLK